MESGAIPDMNQYLPVMSSAVGECVLAAQASEAAAEIIIVLCIKHPRMEERHAWACARLAYA
eukprot:1136123-Pelagomonas_calceolata.AAC.1